MALIRWPNNDSLFSQFRRMQSELDRTWNLHNQRNSTGVYPPVNIYDDGETFLVRSEIPGVDKKNVDINVTGNTLIIKGKREVAQACEDGCYHRREREAGTFRRAVTLPEQVDNTKVNASLNQGILEVILPRAEQAKERTIKIKTN